LKFTIDTEVDSYETAMRTVLAAYGHLPEPSAPQMPPRLPGDVVWQHPGYGGAIWTEEMLRTWARALTDTAALDLVWRVCCEPGLPSVHGQVLAEYVVPDLIGKPALTQLGNVTRRLNTAARELDAGKMPIVIKESARLRIVDPAVAAILLDELAHNPLWPRLRHHTDPPAKSEPSA